MESIYSAVKVCDELKKVYFRKNKRAQYNFPVQVMLCNALKVNMNRKYKHFGGYFLYCFNFLLRFLSRYTLLNKKDSVMRNNGN